MKTLILITTALAFAGTLGASAQPSDVRDGFNTMQFGADNAVEKRRKPRIKGGSGCDDPGDVIEHPECR
jgi:hypothetical protein